jgi:hypothetical protein
MFRCREVLWDVKVVLRGFIRFVWNLVGGTDRLLVPGKFIFGRVIIISSSPGSDSKSRTTRGPPPTFDRVHRATVVPCTLKRIPVLVVLLPLEFLPQVLVFEFMMLPAP